MTDYQLLALADIRDGQWHYGVDVRGRNALPSLQKRGFVTQDKSRKQWQITPEGLEILKEHMPHLKFELIE